MQNYLVLTALGSNSPNITEDITKAVKDCGCNIVDGRMSILGQEFTLVMMLSGPWDAIAKIEDLLPKLEKKLGLATSSRRTKSETGSKEMMPYAIDVVSHDQMGVVHDIAKFITSNDIHIQDIVTNTYKAAYTNTPMFSLHMTVNIPADTSIASLRGEFMEFCDQLNLDAIMEPVK